MPSSGKRHPLKSSSKEDYAAVKSNTRLNESTHLRISTYSTPRGLGALTSHIELNHFVVIDCVPCLHGHGVLRVRTCVLCPFLHFCLFWREIFRVNAGTLFYHVCLPLTLCSPMTLEKYSQYMWWPYFILVISGNRSESVPYGFQHTFCI